MNPSEQMSQVISRRKQAQARASAAWRDLVYGGLQRRALDPIDQEEQQFLSRLIAYEQSISNQLRRLDDIQHS